MHIKWRPDRSLADVPSTCAVTPFSTFASDLSGRIQSFKFYPGLKALGFVRLGLQPIGSHKDTA